MVPGPKKGPHIVGDNSCDRAFSEWWAMSKGSYMGPISTRVSVPSPKIQMSAWLIMKAHIAAIPIVQMATMLHLDKHALSMQPFCKLSIAGGKSNWESNFGMARPLLVPAGVVLEFSISALVCLACTISSSKPP